MVTAVTEGIKVSVKSKYQPYYSSVRQMNFVFAYEICIENNSHHTIQLLKRHWYIIDANGYTREVKGDGVIGVQPVIEPGQDHKYVSGCNLTTTLGKMHGTFLMERQLDGKQFEVNIPEFNLMTPFSQN
ncbi:Co2+/Mg2+ efflux protein ApaG [Arcticibacterium luteifluviistationis]|uniref:Co2+/Mg2+ efflux protein ApaG n=1 Tax=Arcticibacterium luteifluviistationis TaxID=1784714 RepID=A0A2Z4G800_9BACT|nr:Co2+/Mg2+ efflux protein ApaG [Arcticibacterium luteifluviistationis]AWV97311.1 Co2+/Mg2+ efflux protein ApaG [Arcticibacterium luteifluviistationis]